MKKLYFAAVAVFGIGAMTGLQNLQAATAFEDGALDPQYIEAVSCQDYVYYLSDNTGSISNIYRVDVLGNTANLTLYKTLDYAVHIAYNESDGLLYMVRASSGAYRTLDVSAPDGDVSPETFLSTPLAGAYATAIGPNGDLFIGGSQVNKIVSVDIPTGTTTDYADANVNGGDLAFSHDGTLYMATRDGGHLVIVSPGNNEVEGTVSNTVSGLATTQDGDFLFSATGSNSLTGRDADGSSNGVSIALMFENAPFTASGGDLAYGCSDSNNNEECTDFSTYYINHGPGVSGSDLYSVEFDGTDANVELIENFNYQIHFGMDAENGVLYLVNANGSFIEIYDLIGGSLGTLPIVGDINSLYAVVFNPADGQLYVGDDNDNEIYTIDLNTGVATFYAEAPISGGDIVLQDGILYCAQRSANKLHTVVADADGVPDGIFDSVEIGTVPDETNGMSAANNNSSLICAKYGTTTFQEISNVDGTVIETYTIMLDNEPLSIRHGDLASGCANAQNGGGSSCDYKLYYTHQADPASSNNYSLFEVTLNSNGTTVLSEALIEGMANAHIALSPDGTTIYIVDGGVFRTYDVATAALSTDINIALATGQNLSGFPAAVCDSEGTLYVAGGQNSIYTVAPDGTATPVATGVGVDGGDLVFADDELWLIRRDAHEFRNITTPANSFTVDVYEINGAALLENGNILVADGNGESLYKEINLVSQTVVDTYDSGLPLFNGDFAGGCTSNNPDIPPTGECYATAFFDHVQGTSLSGGAVAPNRTNPAEALGAPERTDQLVFISLGYGGSAKYTFGGAVLNGPGPDLEIVETTFGNNDCSSYPEYADIYVGQEGSGLVFAKTVCRNDNFVDIDDASTGFEYIDVVWVVNNNDLTNTPDGFDLDGIVAIHNCEEGEDGEGSGIVESPQADLAGGAQISTYPNPTTDESTVIFEVQVEGRVLLELYNMQGRVVATLANQSASADQSYTFRYDSSSLPDGVYIYKLTTPNGVTTKKLMVSH